MPGTLAYLGQPPEEHLDEGRRQDLQPEAPQFSVVEDIDVVQVDVVDPSGNTVLGEQIAAGAASFVSEDRLSVDGQDYRFDCSGMVCAAHAYAGLYLTGTVASMYDLSQDVGVLHQDPFPRRGDVAFFDNTYDRNNNGIRDDWLSHVGVVESVDEQGTITLVHLGSHGVVRIEMNLLHPSQRRDAAGNSLNSHLRSTKDRDGGVTLTSDLFVAFGSLWIVDLATLPQ